MVGRRNSVGVHRLGGGRLLLVLLLQLVAVGVHEGGVSAAVVSPCWDTPSAAGCEDANVYYPAIEVLADIAAVCTAQPKLSGCSVYKACNEGGGASGPFCNTWSILADLCSGGAGATGVAAGCKHYAQLCGVGETSVTQCSDPQLRPVQSLVSAAVAAADVAAMCDAMSMPDCATCTAALCPDPLLSLGKLCISMPGMTDCLHWKVMCSEDGAEALTAFCGVTSGETCNPAMQMPFHWGYTDAILFPGWVPCSPGWYFLSLLAVAAMALLVSFMKALHAREELHASLSGKVGDDESGEGGSSRSEDGSVSALPLAAGAGGKALGPLFVSREVLGENLKGALFVAVTLSLDYMLMLVAMTFNIGLFGAVIFGFSLGAILFGHKSKQRSALVLGSGSTLHEQSAGREAQLQQGRGGTAVRDCCTDLDLKKNLLDTQDGLTECHVDSGAARSHRTALTAAASGGRRSSGEEEASFDVEEGGSLDGGRGDVSLDVGGGVSLDGGRGGGPSLEEMRELNGEMDAELDAMVANITTVPHS